MPLLFLPNRYLPIACQRDFLLLLFSKNCPEKSFSKYFNPLGSSLFPLDFLQLCSAFDLIFRALKAQNRALERAVNAHNGGLETQNGALNGWSQIPITLNRIMIRIK
jgi:hypothetical protein